jgi:GT2 family glycosyltransferase
MVSFVIPAHNEEVLLPSTLRAIHGAAAGLRYEVIVADDASTDGTCQAAVAGGARVVSINRRQIAAARNAGARAASGDALIFVDADTCVTRGAVQGALEALRADVVGGGTEVEFDGEVPRYARVLLWVMLRLFRALRMCGGCFFFCTRDAFDAAGGWDESLFAGEEVFLARALNGHGKFILLRERVVTSGRKARAYSGAELMGTLVRVSILGRRGVMRREGLELWYERRPDPAEDAAATGR